MRRLIRKLKNPMGKNWERISHDAVVQPLGVNGKKSIDR